MKAHIKFVTSTIRKACCVGLLSMAIASVPLPSQAIPIEEVPNPRQIYGGWVSDSADLLSEATEADLNQMISQLEADNGGYEKQTEVKLPSLKSSGGYRGGRRGSASGGASVGAI